ncbi:conserved hypothetical protein [Sphingomonas sp. EC-HK361]|uniref:hypothetical protein n=1 Tax=Sphingomonas sp. EC-HK361 TaxID=2038397 RepID=UPI0012555A9B|nr:hypothetical protein [Sphingomonas sp. EC-HK361]VVT23601.1 conserved hypothetical protein [Sphingomonas sp. EC-HK361]
MSRGPDAATWFERELVAMANDAGVAIALHAVSSTPWLSATFAGTQLTLNVDAQDTLALDHWLQALPEAEFRPGRYLVADLAVTRRPRADKGARAELAVLIVERC